MVLLPTVTGDAWFYFLRLQPHYIRLQAMHELAAAQYGYRRYGYFLWLQAMHELAAAQYELLLQAGRGAVLKAPPSEVPQLARCASSGRAWRLWGSSALPA